MADRVIRRRDVWPLSAVGFILAVTASWWALALWPVPGAPEWLDRTRSVCFNITDSGLPDAKGWLLLLGQPPTMLAMLAVGWGADVRTSLVHLTTSLGGRAVLGGTLLLVAGGFTLASMRVADARLPEIELPEVATATEPIRLDRAWPEGEGLIDQAGRPFTQASASGNGALVTFAFGHCETVCPAVIHEARAARLAFGRDVPILVLSLDPWRDTPSRLATLVERFQLDPELDRVVSGPVDAVESALDAWGIGRQRNTRTGDIVHPSLVYLVEGDGTLAYASNGARAEVVDLGQRLGWRDTP